MIKVTTLLERVVGLVDGVSEIGKNDSDIDSLVITDELARSGLWFRLACADPDRIICRLYPSCHELDLLAIHFQCN